MQTHELIRPLRIWMALTLAAAVLMTVASVAGLTAPSVYARETAAWASQGVAQDAVNVALILPALLVSVYAGARGSTRALLVWLGLLIYIVYSYILYAFFVHFNALFLVYVATLGCALWSLVGLCVTIDPEGVAAAFDAERRCTTYVVYLVGSGVAFGALWLSSVVPALLAGGMPHDVAEVGLTVNPVHVVDLTFVLPAMILTGVLLQRRHNLGVLFAAPLLTFSVAMGAAIVAMAVVMDMRGLADGRGVALAMTSMSLIAAVLTSTFLRRFSSPHGRLPQ
jgi:hypothetical protein